MIPRALTLLVLASILAGGSWLARTRDRGADHPAGLACGHCHLAGDRTTPDTAHPLVASQERLCGDCHADALTLSHPSGLRPLRPLPRGFPADWKGDLTCSTCHEVHGDGRARTRSARRGRAFCLQCHDSAFFAAMADAGLSIQHTGHLGGGAVGLDLDPYSRQCLDCHADSSLAGNALVDRGGVVRHGSGAASHPIGGDYDQAARSGAYHPRQDLDPAILLPGGKVACVSCHVGYSREHGALVIANAGSRLCMEGHDL